jgi:hypothetical protein
MSTSFAAFDNSEGSFVYEDVRGRADRRGSFNEEAHQPHQLGPKRVLGLGELLQG